MSDDWHPKDKEDLMFAIDRERTALLNLVRGLNEAQMSMTDPGGWTPQDHLAHVTEWIRSFIGYHLDHRPWHEVLQVDQQLTDSQDFDGINDLIFQRKRKLPVWDVITEFQDTCMELYARLNALSFDDLLQPRFPDDPDKRPLLLWVLSNTSEHFAEHRSYIERTVKAKT